MATINESDKKAHLVYMTGLSVDKKRMNNIVELINFDRDFTYWRKECIEEYNEITSRINRLLGKLNSFTNKQISITIDALTSFEEFIDLFNDEYIEKISDANADSMFEGIRNKMASEKLSKIFFSQANQNIQSYFNGDFFSLYLSNQSDSIGVLPLSKVSSQKNFNLHHTYCDLDYYDNKFIDSVIIKVNKNNFNDDIEEDDDNNEYKSLFELLSTESKFDIKSVLQMFGDRNFFGVSLLSSIFYYLQDKQKDSNSNKSLTIKILEEGILGEFCKELIEYSSNPETLCFSSNNPLIELKVYTSDGEKLEKDINILEQDDFFSKMFLDLDENRDSKQRKELIKNKYQYTIEKDFDKFNKQDTNLQYIVSDSDE